MNRKWFFVFLIVFVTICVTVFSGVFIKRKEIGKTVLPVGEDNRVGRLLSEDYGNLPLHFEPNSGQTDARVKFLARGKGYTLFLTGGEAVLKLQKPGQSAVLRMKLAGANRSPQIVGQNELAGKSPRWNMVSPAQHEWNFNNPNSVWQTIFPHRLLIFVNLDKSFSTAGFTGVQFGQIGDVAVPTIQML